ncbi:hypothetical protein HanXRQr2_Chr06g0256121 [Helianthus annuus]|uniref:Uncharacterized protein n=1 Tax=Helianthus annuus TaxID=4232 RepID=A0A251VFH0_HELAN|nr:hypothetical protein HanXRQr2_Chr06g0256121 [Helianthus annuus]KAJ0566616.1 hypothetical protein HanIR_Chr06g0275631 [Helianthus annuus]KAJ0573339.1 hypothetical protein HanHA89_Chr06g0225621 [Helianthus annuus]
MPLKNNLFFLELYFAGLPLFKELALVKERRCNFSMIIRNPTHQTPLYFFSGMDLASRFR